MKGKTIVMTGATSGIGQIAAEKLAAMGARIIFVARSKARAMQTLARLNRIAAGAGHAVHYADLTLLSDMKRVAAEIAAAEPRIDVLINNAGALFGSRKITADGLESTFALNHMSYFVMTEGLRERLIASAPARVINTASGAHRYTGLDLEGLPSGKRFDARIAYGHSKLCNILFTRELARRLDGTGVSANSLHPGFVATRFGDESGGFISPLVRIAKLLALSPEEGAKTLIHLASSDEVGGTSGQYFYKCTPALPSAAARDDEGAKRLWERSAALAGV